MKFSARKAELPLELVVKEVRTKKSESGVDFGASEVELSSELIIGVKFDDSKAELLLKSHHRNEVRRK
ncbi:hypothetical protein COCNU_scaffold008389G000040 [Cocos nucifera]|nr:hypothetical protein [Cocos nucifera]